MYVKTKLKQVCAICIMYVIYAKKRMLDLKIYYFKISTQLPN